MGLHAEALDVDGTSARDGPLQHVGHGHLGEDGRRLGPYGNGVFSEVGVHSGRAVLREESRSILLPALAQLPGEELGRGRVAPPAVLPHQRDLVHRHAHLRHAPRVDTRLVGHARVLGYHLPWGEVLGRIGDPVSVAVLKVPRRLLHGHVEPLRNGDHVGDRVGV